MNNGRHYFALDAMRSALHDVRDYSQSDLAWIMTHPPPFFATWQPIASHEGQPIHHALVLLSDGTVMPGKYSELNHVWLAYTGHGHTAVQPIYYVDLRLACARQRRPQAAVNVAGLD